MRRSVLFVSYTAKRSGPTNSLLLLLERLRERYEVAVLMPGTGFLSDRLAEDNIKFYSFADLGWHSIPSIFKLIRRDGFDLVYGNTKHGSSRNAFIAAKLAGTPFICHVREMGWGKSWRQLGFLHFADAVVAVSQACAASISRFVAPGKLHVVYNGVPVTTDGYSRSYAREYLAKETRISSDCVVIANIGQVSERKGQSLAIQVMAGLVKDIPSSILVLMGGLDQEADYVNRIRDLIHQYRLEQHVYMLGFRQDVGSILRGIDILLHTPLKDPHPRVVLEAMAAEVPVVACLVDGVAETVVDQITGYLLAPGDVTGLVEATRQLASHPELRTEMGLKGKQRVSEFFSADATANNVSNIIERILLK